uniref:hypothetical protein n=1 Tax=Vibrio harveyi TaxID=669 RepID=UPI0018F1EC4C
MLLSGTIKQDITAKAFNLGAVGLALVAIIAIMVIVRFTSMLIHNNGRNLIEVNELSELNQQLTKMIHGLLPCNDVMLFVYDEVANEFVDVTRNHHFSYVDVASYLPVTKHRSMRVDKHDPYDVIARTIAPHQNVIRVPLTKQQHVQGVIYILGATAKTPWVVNIYRNYAQGALNHVLLRQQIQNKDQMTGLMNKNYLRIQLQQTLQ